MGHEETINRLRRIEGQLRGIQRMIEEERDCQEIFVQLAAASTALRRAAVSYFAGRLGECMAQAGESRAHTAEELMDMFVKLA